MFTELLDNIKYALISTLSKIEVATPEMMATQDLQAPQLHFMHQEIMPLSLDETAVESDESDEAQQPFVRQAPKIGRNDPCHCGSGKKFKQCHGSLN